MLEALSLGAAEPRRDGGVLCEGVEGLRAGTGRGTWLLSNSLSEVQRVALCVL